MKKINNFFLKFGKGSQNACSLFVWQMNLSDSLSLLFQIPKVVIFILCNMLSIMNTIPINPPSCSAYPPNSARFQHFRSFGAKPIILSCRGARLCSFPGSKTVKGRKRLVLHVTNAAMAEVHSQSHHEEEEKEEVPSSSSSSAFLDSSTENNSRPRRIALFVEPSPFA